MANGNVDKGNVDKGNVDKGNVDKGNVDKSVNESSEFYDEANNIAVPVGEWVDVSHGMIAVLGTYVDSAGVLRSASDDSCVVWHYKGCTKTGIHDSEIVYAEDTRAPWCPSCWQKKGIMEIFGTNRSSAN